MITVKRSPESAQYALSVLAGVLFGAILVLDLPLKWKGAFTVAVGFVVFLLIVREAERALLFALTFAVPFYVGIGLPAFLTRVGASGQATDISIQVLDILVLALLMVRLARLASRRAEVRLYPAVTVPALAWLVVSGLSSVDAIDTGLAAIQLINMGRLFLLYLVVANSVETEPDVEWLLWALLLGTLCEGLLGAYQGIAGRPLGLTFLGEEPGILPLNMSGIIAYRAYGTIGHGNGYAMYLSATMAFAVALMFSGVGRLHKALAGAVLCVGTLGLVFSLSRGGWLSFMAVFVVVLAFSIRRRRHSAHATWALGGAIVLLVLLLVLSERKLIMSRLVSNDHGAALSRITLAEGAAAMIQDYPMLGVGLNNYGLLMPRYDRISFAAEHGPVIVHNIFLLVAAETGLVGLGCFVWLLTTLVIQAWRLAKRAPSEIVWVAGAGALAGYSALIVHGMVDYAMLENAPLFRIFWLLGAIATGLGARALNHPYASNRI